MVPLRLEWDETKRRTNLEKHGLDFEDVAILFDGRPRIDVPARLSAEARTLTIGVLNDTVVTLVWTWRGPNRRAISFRRARHQERKVFHELYGRAGGGTPQRD